MGVLEEASRGEDQRGRPPLTGVLISLGGIAAFALVVLLVGPLRDGISDAVGGDTEALRQQLRDLDVVGALIVYALAIAHAFVWYPAEILDTATGYVYGFWLALPLVMSGWLLNGVIAYWIGRYAARPLLYRLIGRERLLRYEGVVERGGVTLLLSVRLVPIVPFSLISYAIGSARVPLAKFLWTTALGYLPITAIFVYLGSRLEELSATDPWLWIGALVLIALFVFTRRLARAFEHRPGVAETDRARSATASDRT
jgi:uncharacterized membrane protein YdjX (TVP38/TMEM64 family)